MRFTTLDLLLLSTNLIALGGLIVLMALRGPSGPTIMLTVGALLTAVAKVGRAVHGQRSPAAEQTSAGN